MNLKTKSLIEESESGNKLVTIKITNTKCQIFGQLDPKVIKILDYELSYQLAGYEHATNSGRIYSGWDGRVRLLDKKMQFPIGLLKRAGKTLIEEGVEVQVQDLRSSPKGPPLPINPKFLPRDYQTEVVDLAEKKGSGIIRMCTGSGKTSVISMLAGRFNVNTVIYVIGIELLYQMKETIERILGVKCGMVGDGICEIVDDGINICTIWTAAQAFGEKIELIDCDVTSSAKFKPGVQQKAKIQKMVKEAELFILDECQYAASKSLQFIHRVSESARYRFLLSGTPWREMGDDLLIEAVSGPKFYDLPASKLIAEGVLVPPKIFFMNVPKMKNLHGTYAEVYNSYIVRNITRNRMIYDAVDSLVLAKKKVLILISKVEHGQILFDMLKDNFDVDVLNGTSSSDTRMSAIQDMRDGKTEVLIASKIFDQGIDIPELDALILAGSGKSSARALQRIGRVIRSYPGKKWANVIEFWDNAKYLESHSTARLKIYKSEPGFQIKIEERTMGEEEASVAKPKAKKNDRRGVLPENTKLDWC